MHKEQEVPFADYMQGGLQMTSKLLFQATELV